MDFSLSVADVGFVSSLPQLAWDENLVVASIDFPRLLVFLKHFSYSNGYYGRSHDSTCVPILLMFSIWLTVHTLFYLPRPRS